MNQKAEKPTLSGHRVKARKRDEKERYDATGFRDIILLGLNEANGDLEQVSKFLDITGSRQDYRRYAEPLLDILFAGGLLAPGGSVQIDGEVLRSEYCVFAATNSHDILKAHYEVFFKLIRRYKYIERAFEDELKKLILWLKGFPENEREKLAKITGISLANGLGNPACISHLFEDHLVKDGLSLDFATTLFDAWLKEKDITHVNTTLRRVNLEGRLMELFPINKRTVENFENHFRAAELNQIVDYQRLKANVEQKKELQKQMEEMIKEEVPVKELISFVKEQTLKNSLPEHEVSVMMWTAVMGGVEWNKKEEVVAEQSLKHLKNYTPLLAAITLGGRAEMALIQKIQEYCYDNMNFMKVFQKIVVLFYKADVLSEDAILKWYREAHLNKGKSIFLQQMQSFVEWLQSAEEESEENEENEAI